MITINKEVCPNKKKSSQIIDNEVYKTTPANAMNNVSRRLMTNLT